MRDSVVVSERIGRDDGLRRAGVVAVVILGILNVADVVITRLLLARGGTELNPLADRLLASNTALVVKLGIVAMLAVQLARARPQLPVVCLAWLVVGVYSVVVTIDGSQLVAVWTT